MLRSVKNMVNDVILFVLAAAKGSIKFQILTNLTTLLSVKFGVREKYQGSAGRPYMFVSHSRDTMLIDCDVTDVVVLNVTSLSPQLVVIYITEEAIILRKNPKQKECEKERVDLLLDPTLIRHHIVWRHCAA